MLLRQLQVLTRRLPGRVGALETTTTKPSVSLLVTTRARAAAASRTQLPDPADPIISMSPAAAKRKDVQRPPEEAGAPQKRGKDAPAAAAPAPSSPTYWLVKSEPDEYSVDDLDAGKGGGMWDGVRNFSARNNLRAMRRGDLCLFYHSSCAIPGVVGIAEVTREAYPDPTAAQVGGKYYDAKHTADNPRWFCVDLRLERRLKRMVKLSEIKEAAQGAGKGGGGSVLSGMQLLTRPRLSVQGVTEEEWREVMRMEEEQEGEEGEGKGAGGRGVAAKAKGAGGGGARVASAAAKAKRNK
jgi:predicted RNA-binding protein with PUA-like domain